MKILAALSLLAALAAPAGATTVSAIGSGWISITGASNAPGFGAGLHNNAASYDATVSNDWFEFDLPGARIGSATLSIFNSGANRTVYPTSVFEVHAPTAFSFAGLGAGPALGTITVGEADSGTDGFVHIELNTLGIRYLNAHRGQIVDLGGAIAPAVKTTPAWGASASSASATEHPRRRSRSARARRGGMGADGDRLRPCRQRRPPRQASPNRLTRSAAWQHARLRASTTTPCARHPPRTPSGGRRHR